MLNFLIFKSPSLFGEGLGRGLEFHLQSERQGVLLD